MPTWRAAPRHLLRGSAGPLRPRGPGQPGEPGRGRGSCPPAPAPSTAAPAAPQWELRHLGATSRRERSVPSVPSAPAGETSEGRRGGLACPGSPARPRAGGSRAGPHTKAAAGGAMRELTGGGRTLQMPVCSAMGRILWMKAKGSANSSQLGSKTGHSGGGRNSAMARPGRPLRSALRTISEAAALRARPRGGRGWEKSPPGPGRGGGAAVPPRPRLCEGAPGPDWGGPVGGGGKRQRRLLWSAAWPARRRSHARYPDAGRQRGPESAAHRGRWGSLPVPPAPPGRSSTPPTPAAFVRGPSPRARCGRSPQHRWFGEAPGPRSPPAVPRAPGRSVSPPRAEPPALCLHARRDPHS